MSCNNHGAPRDIEEAVFEMATVIAESGVHFTEDRVANILHGSGAWGAKELNGPKGSLIENPVQEIIDAHPSMVSVHHHTDNPNAKGMDHIAFHRESGTLVFVEDKNWGGGPHQTVSIYERDTPTLSRSAEQLLSMVDMSRLTAGEQRAVRAAALNGNVARVLVTGPYCSAKPQAGVQAVDFETLTGRHNVA